jgi:hypothetical protein
MKAPMLILTTGLLLQPSMAQDAAPSSEPLKYKITFSYGIYGINPNDINDHIRISNDLFGSTTKTIKSVPELAATFAVRPLGGYGIILLRGGSMSVERAYNIAVPETRDTSTITGYATATVKETYTAYPLSFGVGFASSTYDMQAQIEFIYGLGYIREETSYVSTAGRTTSYSRSLFSPAYGFRIGAQTTIRFSANIGLTLEIAYRGLIFDDYENEASAQPAGMKFSYSGINGSIGLSCIF